MIWCSDDLDGCDSEEANALRFDSATRGQVMYPKLRMEEEGATVVLCGVHPAPMKYTGKFG
jgi:hypothetical protein